MKRGRRKDKERREGGRKGREEREGSEERKGSGCYGASGKKKTNTTKY